MSIYHVWITTVKILKLRVYITCVDHLSKSFTVAVSIYHVWIPKEGVFQLQSLYIISGSPQ